MSVTVDRARLEREMPLRGWTAADLAREAGLSGATITAARAGKPMSPRMLRSIARALAGTPAIEGMDRLLGGRSRFGRRAEPGARLPGHPEASRHSLAQDCITEDELVVEFVDVLFDRPIEDERRYACYVQVLYR